MMQDGNDPQPPFDDDEPIVVEDEDWEDTSAWRRFAMGEEEVARLRIADTGEKADLTINGERVTPMKWDWRIVAAWVFFVAYGIVLEFWTVLDGSDATPPLTWVVLRYVPEVIAIGFTTWLVYHFASEFWKKNRVGQ